MRLYVFRCDEDNVVTFRSLGMFHAVVSVMEMETWHL